MTAMIERVARAMARNFNSYHFDRGNSDNGWGEHTNAARAAIAAMREPTDAMVDVMNDVVIDGPAYVDFYPSMADCASLWTAGIDAALNEQVSG